MINTNMYDAKQHHGFAHAIQAENHLLSNRDITLVPKHKKTSKTKSPSNKVCPSLIILLIEDDPIIQKIHRAMLEKLGHRVETAMNAASALLLFSQNRYDMILTDIGLPEISGIEITAEIRRREKSKNPIPIIAVTAYVQEEIKEDCIKAGANAVAIKPLRLDTLQLILQEYTSENTVQENEIKS